MDPVLAVTDLRKVYQMGEVQDDRLTRYRREHVGFVFQFYNLCRH
jgi:ABC-type lipoprotein export system ATPase subunit